jgi:hypothetical protein
MSDYYADLREQVLDAYNWSVSDQGRWTYILRVKLVNGQKVTGRLVSNSCSTFTVEVDTDYLESTKLQIPYGSVLYLERYTSGE